MSAPERYPWAAAVGAEAPPPAAAPGPGVYPISPLARTFNDEGHRGHTRRRGAMGQPPPEGDDFMSLKDQIVLLTGSSGGIGDAVTSALMAEGAFVVGADRVPKKDQPLGAFLPLDITSEQHCADLVQDVTGKYGRIDALIHAAGVLGTTPDPLETTTEEFESVMRTNASGTYSMVREAARSMIGSGTAGGIVVLSSVAAKEARRNYLPYNASKLAVLHIMWSFAQILGPHGIAVNAVAPGPVNTTMWTQFAKDTGPDAAANRAQRAAQLPMGRFAEPEEVARAILFLADPDNRYITGVALDVAGGAHLGMGT